MTDRLANENCYHRWQGATWVPGMLDEWACMKCGLIWDCRRQGELPKHGIPQQRSADDLNEP